MNLNKGGEGIIGQVVRGIKAKQGDLKRTMHGLVQGSVQGTGLADGGEGELGDGGTPRGRVADSFSDEFATSLFGGPQAAGPALATTGGVAAGGGINVTIAKMEFHVMRLTAHEAEIFSNKVMKKVAHKLREFRDRRGGND